MDQADKLRQLVQSAAQQRSGDKQAAIVVICGGQRGVGASTVAFQLALECARRKKKIVLVDASFPTTRSPGGTRLKRRESLVDVLSGGRTVTEALYTGPQGIQLLAGAELPSGIAEHSGKGWDRVVGQLCSLQSPADLLLFDAGAGFLSCVAPLWRQADLILLVSRTEPVSVMDTYATLKLAATQLPLPKIGTVINQVIQPEDATTVAGRVAAAGSRFLDLKIEPFPPIPFSAELHDQNARANRSGRHAPVLEALEALADRVLQHLESRDVPLDVTPAAAA